MIGHPAPKTRGVRTSNHDRSWRSKRWLGRTEFLTRTIQSEPRVGSAQTNYESEMALFSECMRWCALIVLDFADIVRDGDVTPTIPDSAIIKACIGFRARSPTGGTSSPQHKLMKRT